jgi:hypothetical protein
VYFLVLRSLVRCFARAANGNRTALLLPAFPPVSRENAAALRQRTAFIKSGVASGNHAAGASNQAALQPANAPQCACFHHSTLCENALAASFAGVTHQLHPLAGIHSARLLLFSGDAISYVSNRRAQSTLEPSQLLGDVSLLNGELALPMPRVARVSRLIGNSDTTAKVHHWQGG